MAGVCGAELVWGDACLEVGLVGGGGCGCGWEVEEYTGAWLFWDCFFDIEVFHRRRELIG